MAQIQIDGDMCIGRSDNDHNHDPDQVKPTILKIKENIRKAAAESNEPSADITTCLMNQFRKRSVAKCLTKGH